MRAPGLATIALLAAACGNATPAATATPSPSPTATATAVATVTASPACDSAAVVNGWPLVERLTQLIVVPAIDGHITALYQTISAGAGGVLLLGSPGADFHQQITIAQRLAAVPPMIMVDQEGGGVQRLGAQVQSLPWPRQMAQTMTATAVESAAASLGAQMHALGVTADLAPVLDVDGGAGPNERNPDGSRSFSAEPATASTYGLAFASGLRKSGVLPVVKHFPGLGGSNANTDYSPASTLPLATLQTTGLPPFRAAISAGLPAVMVANATVPGLTTGPASLSSAAISDLLRRQLSFTGLVMTDSLSAGAITAAGLSLPDATVAAIAAGADMVLFGSTLTAAETALLSPDKVTESVLSMVQALTTAVESGRLPTSRVTDAVLHVLAAKNRSLC
ncbi:MAG TPA: glycoside hydrolase family 3 N-terminal domain-containing protein [Candidatus Dormibacteraeota bacterium]|jgi:beta-N-acetylhexosaminidase|nr:glycoside hydrolase family 3 N-terminal domain-containing protein [Candidatus Dormibacteraeota bacterium]